MATPPFMKMPTEMVCEITSFLNEEDLCNFRLVSHWTERESFCDFATKWLWYMEFEGVSGKIMPRRLKAVESSLQFASAIKHVKAKFSERMVRNWESDLVKGSNNALFGDQTLAGHAKEPTLSYMVSRLPKFEGLTIEHLSGPILNLHILPGLVNAVPQDAWWRLRSLYIVYGELSSSQWLSLIRLASPTLTHLSLVDTVCTKGRWLPVLTAIQGTLPALTSLSLIYLSHRQLKPLATNECIDVNTDFMDRQKTRDESVEPEEGSEELYLRVDMAMLRGRQAVQLGLEKIVRYQECIAEALLGRF
ncbi:hypothetical protein LTS10_000865 [Elasticomyces elasticus]|nr:hypothetical protein LTS10_000865 [Elasticomyces elasticus]